MSGENKTMVATFDAVSVSGDAPQWLSISVDSRRSGVSSGDAIFWIGQIGGDVCDARW